MMEDSSASPSPDTAEQQVSGHPRLGRHPAGGARELRLGDLFPPGTTVREAFRAIRDTRFEREYLENLGSDTHGSSSAAAAMHHAVSGQEPGGEDEALAAYEQVTGFEPDQDQEP